MATVRRRGNGQTRRSRSNYDEEDEDYNRRERHSTPSSPSGLASSNLTIVLFVAILVAGIFLFVLMDKNRVKPPLVKKNETSATNNNSNGSAKTNITPGVMKAPTTQDMIKQSVLNTLPTKKTKSKKKTKKKPAKKVDDALDLKVVGKAKPTLTPKKLTPAPVKKEVKPKEDDVSQTNVRMFGDNPEMLEAKRKRDKEREERRKKKAAESE